MGISVKPLATNSTQCMEGRGLADSSRFFYQMTSKLLKQGVKQEPKLILKGVLRWPLAFLSAEELIKNR